MFCRVERIESVYLFKCVCSISIHMDFYIQKYFNRNIFTVHHYFPLYAKFLCRKSILWTVSLLVSDHRTTADIKTSYSSVTTHNLPSGFNYFTKSDIAVQMGLSNSVNVSGFEVEPIDTNDCVVFQSLFGR